MLGESAADLSFVLFNSDRSCAAPAQQGQQQEHNPRESQVVDGTTIWIDRALQASSFRRHPQVSARRRPSPPKQSLLRLAATTFPPCVHSINSDEVSSNRRGYTFASLVYRVELYYIEGSICRVKFDLTVFVKIRGASTPLTIVCSLILKNIV